VNNGIVCKQLKRNKLYWFLKAKAVL